MSYITREDYILQQNGFVFSTKEGKMIKEFLGFDDVAIDMIDLYFLRRGDFVKSNGRWESVIDVYKVFWTHDNTPEKEDVYRITTDSGVTEIINNVAPLTVVVNGEWVRAQITKCHECDNMAIVSFHLMGDEYLHFCGLCASGFRIGGEIYNIVKPIELTKCFQCGQVVEKTNEDTEDLIVFKVTLAGEELNLHYHRDCWFGEDERDGYDESTNPSNGWRSPR
jgi:hypothetical protein